MKRSVALFFVFLIVMLGSIGFYYKGGDSVTGSALDPGDSSAVSRSFVGGLVDEDISVVVSVSIDSGFTHNVYIVEENVPSEFTIMDAGGAAQSGNVLRWSDIDDVNGLSSVDLTYVVRTSQTGAHSFSGSYGLDGMDSSAATSGPILIVGMVDTTAPTFNYVRSSPVSYSDSFSSSIDFNWADDVGVTQSFVESNFSGSLINSSGASWSGVLGAGSYRVRGWARDAAGNWGVTPVYVFRVLKRDVNLSLNLNEVQDNITIGIGGSLNVEVDALKDFVLYEDGVEISEGLRYYLGSGLFNLTAIVLDDANYTGSSLTWFVNVAGVLSHYITWDPSDWLAGTTNFSDVNLTDFSARLVNGHGEILFLENLNVLRNLNLNSKIIVEDNRIFIDSDSLPEFDLSSRLKFYNIDFIDPKVWKDDALCSSCAIVSYSGGILTVDVDGFSEYIVREDGYAPPEPDENEGGSGESVSTDSGACISDYSCGEWGTCLDGLSERICTDLNGCSVDKAEEASCGSTEDSKKNGVGGWSGRPISVIRYLVIVFSILGLIAVPIWAWLKFKKTKLVVRGIENKE